MAQTSSTLPGSLVVLVLKISPLVFSVVVRKAGQNFDSRWQGMWKQYCKEEEFSGDWTERSSKFHVLSLYAYDKSTVVSTMKASLFFLVILHLLLIVQVSAIILLIPAIIFLILALIVDNVASSFYKMNADGRNPARYEKYYYDSSAGISDYDKEAYKRWFLPKRIDRYLSPPRATIIIDILIIIDIAALEILLVIYQEDIKTMFSVQHLPAISAGFSVIISVVIIIVAFLVFPTKSSV